MLATIVVGLAMMTGLFYAAISPIDSATRLVVLCAIGLYIFGIGYAIRMEAKYAERALDLFRITIPLGTACAFLGVMISGMARHLHK
jgi:uncharacterized membrane protein YczE